MDQLRGEEGGPWPVGEDGNSVPAGGDHQGPGEERPGRGGQPPQIARLIDPNQLRVKADAEPVMWGVLLEISHEVVPGRIAPEASRHAESLQVRHDAPRVQPKFLVSRPPARAYGIGALKNDGFEAAALEGRSSGEPRGACTNHDRFVLFSIAVC